MDFEIVEIDYSTLPYLKVKCKQVFEFKPDKPFDIVFDDLQSELLESIDCYDKTYAAIGQDENGVRFSATAAFSCGEFVELSDIELV